MTCLRSEAPATTPPRHLPSGELGHAQGSVSPRQPVWGRVCGCGDLCQALGVPAPVFLILKVGTWPCRPAWGGCVACRSFAPWLIYKRKSQLLLEFHEKNLLKFFRPVYYVYWQVCLEFSDFVCFTTSPFFFSELSGSSLVGSVPSSAVWGGAYFLTPALLYPQVWSSCGARMGSC